LLMHDQRRDAGDDKRADSAPSEPLFGDHGTAASKHMPREKVKRIAAWVRDSLR
jgi:hypothetical protein